MKDKLLIVGTGDYAESAFYFLNTDSDYTIVGFAENRAYRKKDKFCDLPVFDLDDIESSFSVSALRILVAIGPNKVNTVRERIYTELKNKGFSFIKFIHKRAFVWSEDAIGENSFIFPNVIVEPFAYVGNNCVLWSGSILAHHVIVGDHCFLAPGVSISGRTRVHNNCFLGINCTIRDNIIIKERCIIGAGAVVKKTTTSSGVYSSNETPLLNTNSFSTKV